MSLENKIEAMDPHPPMVAASLGLFGYAVAMWKYSYIAAAPYLMPLALGAVGYYVAKSVGE